MPQSEAATTADSTNDPALQIDFDNESDPVCTVVTVEGKDKAHLLITLAGALSSAGLTVVSASIHADDGRIMDVFHVKDAEGKKVGTLPVSSALPMKSCLLGVAWQAAMLVTFMYIRSGFCNEDAWVQGQAHV